MGLLWLVYADLVLPFTGAGLMGRTTSIAPDPRQSLSFRARRATLPPRSNAAIALSRRTAGVGSLDLVYSLLDLGIDRNRLYNPLALRRKASGDNPVCSRNARVKLEGSA